MTFRLAPMSFATATLALLLCALPGHAQQAAPAASSTPAPPAWEQLTPAQRETLIAPLRERWNTSDGEGRQRMLDHAQRWHSMTPEQRQAAHKGMRRWSHLTPDQREEARELYQRMRAMPPDDRRVLKEQWRKMTPGQRKAWLEQHPPL